jgi:hypothetical protein
MSDYQIVKKLLEAERRRLKMFYRYRPSERGAMDKKMADGLAALQRLRVEGEWKAAGQFWQDKFDK